MDPQKVCIGELLGIPGTGFLQCHPTIVSSTEGGINDWTLHSLQCNNVCEICDRISRFFTTYVFVVILCLLSLVHFDYGKSYEHITDCIHHCLLPDCFVLFTWC